MAKLILEVQDEKEALLELANILIKLRYYTKEWEIKYGISKLPKKYWENKADEWLKKKIKKQ